MLKNQSFVTQELEQYIKRELYKKRHFSIPGVGTIQLIREAAKFSDDKSTILPPNFHLQLTQHRSDDGIDKSNYKSSQIELANRIKVELETTSKSKVKGLGVFQKENDKIKFYPDNDLEKSFSMGLEPIYGVKEVSKTFGGSPTIVGETLVYSKPKKDYTAYKKYGKIIGWTILGMALLYALLNIPINLPNDNIPIVKEKVTPPRKEINAVADTVTPVIAPVEIENSTEIVDQASANNNIKTEEPKIKEEIPVVPKSKSSSKNVVKTNSIPSTSKPDSNQISKLHGKPCAIITGSFKSATYSIRMIKKLQKLGYKVYTEETDSMTRVGLLYDCKKINEVDLLEKIKSSVDTNSWILQ
jgi:cell division septation protein DedD